MNRRGFLKSLGLGAIATIVPLPSLTEIIPVSVGTKGYINYKTGAVELVTPVELTVTKIAVHTKNRKLRARWSMVAQQDMLHWADHRTENKLLAYLSKVAKEVVDSLKVTHNCSI